MTRNVSVLQVCARLGLVSLAYMWHQPQAALLRGMISSGIEAILIKVAALGLMPERHLGKTLQEMEPHLHKICRSAQFDTTKALITLAVVRLPAVFLMTDTDCSTKRPSQQYRPTSSLFDTAEMSMCVLLRGVTAANCMMRVCTK